MARQGQGRRDSDRAGMLTSRLTNAPAPTVKPPAPKPYADPRPAPRAPVAPKTAPKPTPAPVVAPKPVVKPPAPKPYADPAPVTPAPRASVTPKTFTAPAPAPVAEVITDINADSTIDDTTAWELPEYAYGVKVADDKALAQALTRQNNNPAQRTPLLDLYAKKQGAEEYNWNEATKHTSVEASQAGYAAEYADIVAQVADQSVLNNASAYRNEALASDGRQAMNPLAQEAAITRINDYLDTNNLPLSKEINGQTVYLTLGETGMQGAADAIYRTDSGISIEDDQKGRDDNTGRFVSHGEVGTYSTIYQPPVSDFDNPYVQVAGMLVPAFGTMMSVMKGAAGETLHASDWGKIVTTGLELSGDLVVPTTEAPEGAGFNFGNTTLTYDQSTALLDTAAGGDPVSAVMGVYGNGIIEDAVGSSEALQGSLDALGMSPEAFASAASKAATKLAQGEDLDDSLISGLGTYIKEGGGIGTPDLGLGGGGMFDGLLEAGREFDDQVLQPVKELVEGVAGSVVDGLGEIGSTIVDLGSQVNKDVVKPAVDVVQDVAETVVEAGSEAHKTITQPIFRAIDEVGHNIDDEALQPIKDVVESVASQVGEAGSEFDDAVLQPTKDFLESLGSGLEDAVKAGGRVFDDVVLQPLKDLLEGLFDIVSPVAETVLGGLAGGAVAPQAPLSATRTTDELFSSMIELGSTQERLEFEDFDSDPFGDTTQGYSI